METFEMYDASSITVLKGLEGVRRRPGMYFGGTGGMAIHHALLELVSNAVDEFLRGNATRIDIRIEGERITVTDDGHGIPVEVVEGKPLVEWIMGSLHGGSVARPHIHLRPGLHGVGVACVNAVAARFDVEVCRDARRYAIGFEAGELVAPLQDLGTTEDHGTTIAFTPDFSIFEPAAWDRDWIAAEARKIAALNAGLVITIDGLAYRCPDGLADRARWHARTAETLHGPFHLRGERDGILIEAAIGWTFSGEPLVEGFINGSPADGTHVEGLFAGLSRALAPRIPRCADEVGFRSLVSRGLVAIVHATMMDPVYGSPTRSWMREPRAATAVRAFVAEHFADAAAREPALLDLLVDHFGGPDATREASGRPRVRRRSRIPRRRAASGARP